MPSATLGATLPPLLPPPGKASGRESRTVEMRVDAMAMPALVDLSGGHGSWPEPRYHLPLRPWVRGGVQVKKGPDTPFLRLDAQEEPAPGSRSASERRQSRFLLNCTWEGSPRKGLGALVYWETGVWRVER